MHEKPRWKDYWLWLAPVLRQSTQPTAPAPEITALTTDSRSLQPGQWFFPLRGESFDGHDFVTGAMAKGAAGFFYAEAQRSEIAAELLPQGVAVTDVLAAFQHIATGWRRQLTNLKLLALTGSAGKTTTKEMLSAALTAAGRTLATHGSFNNEIGVPKTLLSLTPQLDYAVLEFGARESGNIRFLCQLAEPEIVGLLNVGTAHLGVFGSVERLLATKLEILRDSRPDAVQVVYGDDARILVGAKATGKQTLTFGTSDEHDIRLVASRWQEGGGMEVELATPSGPALIPLGVAHAVLPINVAAAIAMGLAAGAPLASLVRGLSGFSGVKGRYQVHARGDLTVVDDTYNANPDSMRAGLSTVARAYAGRRVALVLGDMLELGEAGPGEHERLGEEQVAPLRPAALLTVGPLARGIATGAVNGGMPAARVHSFANVDELLAANFAFASQVDVVYAKGSNGIKLARLVDQLLAR